LGDAFMGRRQFVGLDAGGAFDDSGVDQRLALPPKQGGLSDPCFDRDGGDGFTRSQTLAICRRTVAGYIRGHVTSR
jgi:hypothetical protein